MKHTKLTAVFAAMTMILMLGGCETEEGIFPTASEGIKEQVEEETSLEEDTAQSEEEMHQELEKLEEEEEKEPKLQVYTNGIEETEDTDTAGLLENLYINMSAQEYLGEAVHLLEDAIFTQEIVDGKLPASRNYDVVKNGVTLLQVQMGVNLKNAPYVYITYFGENGVVRTIRQEDTTVEILDCSITEDAFDGAYSKITIQCDTGSITRENGTYKMGLKVGDFTKESYKGKKQAAAFDVWTMQEEFTYKKTVTSYDEEGNEIKPEPEPQKPVKKPSKPATTTPTPAPEPAPAPETPTPPAPETTPLPDSSTSNPPSDGTSGTDSSSTSTSDPEIDQKNETDTEYTPDME